ncbi:MAG: glycosyltransferase, partial [Deltaproteobacteria bacterium]|nr:glycosyltransferase [Deltaproteobacteria bacterium]
LPAALVRDLPLVLAGPVERVDAAMQQRLERPRNGRLVRLGFSDPALLPALYRHAAAFVLPSLYEGFGLPLVEAMACGAPCVTSDDPALVEVAGGAALHFARSDAPACARELTRVLEDSALRKSLAEGGPVRARAFSWVESARQHLAAYRAAAEER